MSRTSCLPAAHAPTAPQVACRDLAGMVERITAAPTRADAYNEAFEDMLRAAAGGNVELVGKITLPSATRAPAWSFDLDCDGARMPGGRVNAYCASDAMHEVAKVLAQDELNGSGDCAGDVVVTLHRVKS